MSVPSRSSDAWSAWVPPGSPTSHSVRIESREMAIELDRREPEPGGAPPSGIVVGLRVRAPGTLSHVAIGCSDAQLDEFGAALVELLAGRLDEAVLVGAGEPAPALRVALDAAAGLPRLTAFGCQPDSRAMLYLGPVDLSTRQVRQIASWARFPRLVPVEKA